MLRISHDQMNVFRSALAVDLEDRLFNHACSSYLEPLRIFGREYYRTLVQLVMQKAAQYRYRHGGEFQPQTPGFSSGASLIPLEIEALAFHLRPPSILRNFPGLLRSWAGLELPRR